MNKDNQKNQPKYINRELSWLEFNQRVLDQAGRESTPLLERLKFVAITSSNLDEFFMVRVGGLTLLSKDNPLKVDFIGLTADQQLTEIRNVVRKSYSDLYSRLLDDIEPKLAAEGIERIRVGELNKKQRSHLSRHYHELVASVISPIAVFPKDDFPWLTSAPICLCVRIKNEPSQQLSKSQALSTDPLEDRFAIIPLSRALNRIISIPSGSGFQYVLLEDVVTMFIDSLFPKQTVLECIPFRVTRNADISLDEDGAEDLVREMTELLQARKSSDCIRLEVAQETSKSTREFLMQALAINEDVIYDCQGPIAPSVFMKLGAISGYDNLKDESWSPQPSPDFEENDSVFDVISQRDQLLVHPYQSYHPVIELLEQAAQDPDVIAIKQTLYRTSTNSKIVQALADAAQNGKAVTVIVELKARFDEERNIEWARHLERSGVDVIYGVRGLKTHAKICIIVRRQPEGIQRYVHYSTGNYNEATARIYSDVSLFTCDRQLGDESISFFNSVTGYSAPQALKKIIAAPIGLRDHVLELIETETNNAKNGLPARIEAKLNSLVDKQLIDSLYGASQAGVEIELNIRGICCLRPGVPGVSDNIRVISIVDRYLEHCRIFHFYHGGDHRVFISSADWMSRNLDKRVEIMVPVENSDCKQRLIRMLQIYFSDNTHAHTLCTDGSYALVSSEKTTEPIRSQQEIYNECREHYQAHSSPHSTVFIPHRGESESA